MIAMKPLHLIVTFSLMIATIAHGQDRTAPAQDTGTRGGGESVDISGRPVLRDLVDRTVCHWRTGETVFAAESRLSQALQALARHHWYMALALEREIKSLHFCMTENLTRVSTTDAEGLTIFVEDTRQAAIRLNGTVYMNETLYRRMNPTSRAYLLIHEALHSFIPMDSALRNRELRSTINAMERMERGQITTDDFAYQLEMNNIHRAFSTHELDAHRTLIEDVLRGRRSLVNWGSETNREERRANLALIQELRQVNIYMLLGSHWSQLEYVYRNRIADRLTRMSAEEVADSEAMDDLLASATPQDITTAFRESYNGRHLNRPLFDRLLQSPHITAEGLNASSQREDGILMGLLKSQLLTYSPERQGMILALIADSRVDINATSLPAGWVRMQGRGLDFEVWSPSILNFVTLASLYHRHDHSNGATWGSPLLERLYARSDLQPNRTTRVAWRGFDATTTALGHAAHALLISAQDPSTDSILLENFDRIMGDPRTDLTITVNGTPFLHAVINMSSSHDSSRVQLLWQHILANPRVDLSALSEHGETLLMETLPHLTSPGGYAIFRSLLSSESRRKGSNPLALAQGHASDNAGQNLLEMAFGVRNGELVPGNNGGLCVAHTFRRRWITEPPPLLSLTATLARLLGNVTAAEGRALLTAQGPNGTVLERARELRDHCHRYTGDETRRLWNETIQFLERESEARR